MSAMSVDLSNSRQHTSTTPHTTTEESNMKSLIKDDKHKHCRAWLGRSPLANFFSFLVLALLLYRAAQAQELPTLNLPLNNFSTSHRQNVCERQQAYANGTVEFRNALQGMNLNVWIAFGALSALNPGEGRVPEPPGLQVEIMDELALRAGFTWRNSFGVTNLTNLTIAFGELLDWSIRSYDVSVGAWSKTRERIERGNSFPHGYADASIIMVAKLESGKKIDVWSFLDPFDWVVWVMILVTYVVCGLVYLWMEKHNTECDRQELHNSPTEVLYFSYLTFIGDTKFQPSTDYARFFVLALAFWGLLVSSAYTANLASFLVSKHTPSFQVDSVDEAVQLDLPICVMYSSAQDTLISDRYPNAQLIRRKLDPNTGTAPMYEALRRGDCKVLLTTLSTWESEQMASTHNPDCNLEWVGRVFKFLQAGMATLSDSGTLCTSLIRDVLSLHLVEMEETGFIDRATERFVARTTDQQCAGSDESSSSNNANEESQQLTIADMGGLFIILYTIAAISVVKAYFTKRKVKIKRKTEMGMARSQMALAVKQARDEENHSGDLNASFPSQMSSGSDQLQQKSKNKTTQNNKEINPASALTSETSDKIDHLVRELEALKNELIRKKSN